MFKPRLLSILLLFSLLLNALLYTRLANSPTSAAIDLQSTAVSQAQGEPPAAHRQHDLLTANELNILFEAGEMEAALQGYIWLAQHQPAAAQQLKESWLARLSLWIENSDQLSLVEKVIVKARALLPDDNDFLFLSLDYLLATGQPMAAIDALYERINSVDVSRQGFYVSRLQKVLKQLTDKLVADQAWQQIVNLGQHLLWYEPQHPPYALLTARAYMQLENYVAAKPILQSVSYDEHYGEKAKALLEEIGLMDLQQNSIRLTAKGAHYLVEGTLNNHYPLQLMIDTGASMSVISSQALGAMNVTPMPEFVREAQINTAGGTVTASIYRFERFAIENYSLSNIEFVVMPLQQNSGGAGLLGMNFLNKFSFHIDQKNHLLVLKPQ